MLNAWRQWPLRPRVLEMSVVDAAVARLRELALDPSEEQIGERGGLRHQAVGLLDELGRRLRQRLPPLPLRPRRRCWAEPRGHQAHPMPPLAELSLARAAQPPWHPAAEPAVGATPVILPSARLWGSYECYVHLAPRPGRNVQGVASGGHRASDVQPCDVNQVVLLPAAPGHTEGHAAGTLVQLLRVDFRQEEVAHIVEVRPLLSTPLQIAREVGACVEGEPHQVTWDLGTLLKGLDVHVKIVSTLERHA
mmetsp:Transcript_23342/g.59593  ORF Transcript_23342/g.59593 Transcript_23342/m.59593 type:complete len:250 (-) Transcript_23342:163-912(-)